MPSRKLTSHCPQCGCKNHLRAAYCNQCGLRLKDDRAIRDQEGRTKLYADIAHPINSKCREMIQERVIREFEQELERAQDPSYVSRYDDDYFDELPPEKPPVENRKVQEGAKEPRPPHRVPNKRTEEPGSEPQKSEGGDDFGAGIF